jgi:hypothetical protein
MSSPRTDSLDFHWMNYAQEYIAIVQGSFRGTGEFRLLDLQDRQGADSNGADRNRSDAD